MTVRSELELIYEQNPNGLLQPEAVIDWAAHHRESDLYQQFEWNDKIAGHAHRLWQARQIIRITFRTEGRQPQMISLSIDRLNPGGGYRNLEVVMAHDDMRAIALRDALNELERMQERYSYLQELSNVWKAAAKIRRKQPKKKGGVEARP